MAEKHWLDDRHYRVLSSDGRRATIYQASGVDGVPDTRLEIVEVSRPRKVESAA